jgi:hypothetical protein
MKIHPLWRFGFAISVIQIAACNNEGTPTPHSDAGLDASPPMDGSIVDVAPSPTTGFIDPALVNKNVALEPSREGLQYHGAVALSLVVQAEAEPLVDAEPLTEKKWLELSAPILPKTTVLYQGQGANYPNTPQAAAALAHDAALTFDTMLRECQPLNPAIVLWKSGEPPLSKAQVQINYQLLADCAYIKYTAKPYWIPQLLLDVDICGQELGEGWRMPTEADIKSITPKVSLLMQQSLAGDLTSQSAGGPYFSMNIWVIQNDGSIASVVLDPTGKHQFAPLISMNGTPTVDLRSHYEGSLALRCIRLTEN